MKKIDLGQAVSVLANVGVIAGIVFLAVELRQNNELLETEARRGLMQNRIDSNRVWAADGDLMQLRQKAHNGEPLTDAETWRLQSDFAAVMTAMEWEYEQFQNGRVSYAPVEGWRFVLSRWSYMRPMWADYRRRFSPEFARFVDEELLDSHEVAH